ncbi:MAG: hypothetical protein BGO31_12710 [Bacteroidetes bacterium 43-16]|nr:MAG: hypothetical protein BGO31_12710 [Bacteroidetes bacterium 43-16]
MTVIDMNGCSLQVTDLEQAIAQMHEFKDLQHDDPVISEQDRFRQVYYRDLYEKLLQLKEQLNNTINE